MINRSAQYSMSNVTGNGHFWWSGRLNKNPDLWMVGEVLPRAGAGDVFYTETLYDHRKGDAIIMHSEAVCTHETPAPVVASSPAPAPAVTAIVPAPSPAASSMPVMFKGSAAYASISLGTMPVIAPIDTGATGMAVTQKVADWLVSNGQATTTTSQRVGYADGSLHDLNHIVINSVTIAGHELRNIEAGVMPDGADILLGLGVLNQVSTKVRRHRHRELAADVQLRPKRWLPRRQYRRVRIRP